MRLSLDEQSFVSMIKINAMNITLAQPYAITDKGKRSNNEDAIFPPPESDFQNQKLFIVCDGVGGAEKGEIASNLACESINSYFKAFSSTREAIDKSFVQKAIEYTETRFEDYISNHPEATGMATTLTLAYLGKSQITIAHIGDSRIYHIREGQIIHKTEDHSLVNYLVKTGQLTPEEALAFPKKNIILRAIQGSHNPAEVDVAILTNIMPGDYLFLCTDGVLEKIDDEKLMGIFKKGGSNCCAIKEMISDICAEKSRDNYSFYIIPIQKTADIAEEAQKVFSFFYSLI